MSFAAYRDPPPHSDCPQCDDLRYEIEQLRIDILGNQRLYGIARHNTRTGMLAEAGGNDDNGW